MFLLRNDLLTCQALAGTPSLTLGIPPAAEGFPKWARILRSCQTLKRQRKTAKEEALELARSLTTHHNVEVSGEY